MQEPELIAIGPDEPFQFQCGPGVACFNQCCQDLNQALTPYDVLRLRTHLNLSWDQFQVKYAALFTGPSTGLPVAALRFRNDREKKCPFVTPKGCSVYAARPTSCRLYPVARAIQRSREDGRITEHFALIKEAHCRGFENGPKQTVRQWLQSQEALIGLAVDDQMMELIALKNRLRPGPLASEQQQWAVMAFYDLGKLKEAATTKSLPAMNADGMPPLPDIEEEVQWLAWAMDWLREALFGKHA